MPTPPNGLLPSHIFSFLASRVLGQDETLRAVSVAVYKHLRGLPGSRVFLIGSSGTGKTTIMRAIQQFFMAHESLRPFSAMCIVNARTLVDENGDVDVFRVFQHMEADALRLLGPGAAPKDVAALMARGTICLDEVDKISGKLGGRPDVVGLSLQQALLTFIEGELVQYAFREQEAAPKQKLSLNTAHMLFVCGGAFEELHDQVYHRVENKEDERRLKEVRSYDSRMGMRTDILFTLRDYLKLTDLYAYGMAPQFISRFAGVTLLEDLGRGVLREIFLKGVESPYLLSQKYFKTMGIDFSLTPEAVDVVVDKAYDNARIGARALREAFAKVITDIEFDPFASKHLTKNPDGLAITLEAEFVFLRLNPLEDESPDALMRAAEDAAAG